MFNFQCSMFNEELRNLCGVASWREIIFSEQKEKIIKL